MGNHAALLALHPSAAACSLRLSLTAAPNATRCWWTAAGGQDYMRLARVCVPLRAQRKTSGNALGCLVLACVYLEEPPGNVPWHAVAAGSCSCRGQVFSRKCGHTGADPALCSPVLGQRRHCSLQSAPSLCCARVKQGCCLELHPASWFVSRCCSFCKPLTSSCQQCCYMHVPLPCPALKCKMTEQASSVAAYGIIC